MSLSSTGFFETVGTLKGLQLNEVVVGDGGFHLEFGKLAKTIPGCATGEVSIYGTCALKLTTTGVLLYHSVAIPLPEAGNDIKKHILGYTVIEAAVDLETNSLRVILENHVLMSLFPIGDSESAWVIFRRVGGRQESYVVARNNVSNSLA